MTTGAPDSAADAISAVGPWTVDTVVAHALQSFPTATGLLAKWQAGRARSGDEEKALSGFLQMLQRRDHTAECASIVDALVERFPEEPWSWALAGDLAARAGNHAASRRFGEELQTRFPKSSAGPRLIAGALLKAKNWGEAQAFVAALKPVHAREKWALEAEIALSRQAQDHARTLAAGERLEAAAPKSAAGVLTVALALRELGRLDDAEAALKRATARFPDSENAWREAASLAEGRGDYEEALARFAECRARFPDLRAAYTSPLRIVQKLGRLELAPAIVEAGLTRFADDRIILSWAARLAALEQDTIKADGYWQRLVTMFPDDADIALSAALGLVGGKMGRGKRWPKVFARLDAMHARFADYVPAYVAHVDGLREAGRLDEAEANAAVWCARFPDDIKLTTARARVAEERGDFAAALAQIGALRARAAPSPITEAAYARALSCAGHFDEADAAAQAAMAQFPSQHKLLVEYARLATRRGDFLEALHRWLEAQRQLPNDLGISKEVRSARLQAAEQGAVSLPDEAAADNVYARFESLGGSFLGCEFGIVQRMLGSETLGLLRWTRIDPPELIAALENDFDGVGAEEHTVLKTMRGAHGQDEYVTADTRYTMKSNTFIKAADAPADKMFTQTCRRLRFLRGKLLEDLKAAERIFVYKSFEPIDDATIRRMSAALRRYGDLALLCVQKADAAHSRGSVRVLERGIMAGYIGFFMKDEERSPGGDIETWKTLLKQADALWSAARQQTPIAVAA